MPERIKSYPFASGGFHGVGYLLTCRVCGRKIIVNVALNGVNHNVAVDAGCADCIDLDHARTVSPEAADMIAAFRSGSD